MFHILVVEDDKNTSKLMHAVLKHAGYSVIQASDGIDALTVSRNGIKQTLPQKEFYLLYKLLSYPDRIFTRLQLMDEIWGMESNTVDTTINVHINRLRKRFGGWTEFELKAIRGIGYKAVIHHENK